MSSQTVSDAVVPGLPVGVEAGPLAARLVAQLVDLVVPTVLVVISSYLSSSANSVGVAVVVSVVGALLVAGWFVVVWGMFANRAAGPGMRLMKLQLVGLRDGRPIGWGRFFVRSLILVVLSATGVGLVLLLIFLAQHVRRQGWHDLAVSSVVIKERPLAPIRPAAASSSRPVNQADPARMSGNTQRDTVTGRALAPSVQGGQSKLTDQGDSAPSSRPVPAEPGPFSPLESPMSTADSVKTSPRAAARPTPTGHEAPMHVDNQPLDQGWFAVLDDGREVGISGLVLLGRNPQARPGEDEAELIKVADETRTVSKTHLALSVDANGLFIMDRGSTNGTSLTDAGGVTKSSPAGDVLPLEDDSIVSFGDHWLRIEHRG